MPHLLTLLMLPGCFGIFGDGDGKDRPGLFNRDDTASGDDSPAPAGCQRFQDHAGAASPFSLPNYGTPGNGYNQDQWFMESYDRYSDGLNWFLSDLTGDGAPDLVVTFRDDYVRTGPSAENQGQSAWILHENQGDGFHADGRRFTLPNYGTPGNGYNQDQWFMEGFDRYSDGLNWFLSDLTGDGKPDLVAAYRDDYVRTGPSAENQGQSAWILHENTGDGFDADGRRFTLPNYGTPGSGYDQEQWFNEGYDRYSDGLNWALTDLTGDGKPDLVVTYRDEYVRTGPSAENQGQSAWILHENTGDGFDADGRRFTLPNYGTPGNGYDWEQWFKESSDRYSDGLNFTLADLSGDGKPDLVVTSRDDYVRTGPSVDGQGQSAWALHESSGDGFDADGRRFALPNYGTPGNGYDWENWFKEPYDRYSDGLNFALTDLTGDGAPDLVATFRDDYVRTGPSVDGQGQSAWTLHENTGDGLDADGSRWNLPNYGEPGNGYDWEQWFMEPSDRYSDGLNWALTDLNGDGGPDLVITSEDDYVRIQSGVDNLGQSAWAVHAASCAD